MAMQRQNPLPNGTYWVDVFAPEWTKFRAWLAAHKDTVHVKTTESTSVDGTEKDAQGDPARDWYLFEVTGPTKWEGPGFPTIADSTVKSSSDTVQRPEPEKDLSTKIGDTLGGLPNVGGTVAKIGMGIVAVGVLGLAGYFAFRAFSNNRSAPHE